MSLVGQVWLLGYGSLLVLGFFSAAYKEPRLLSPTVSGALRDVGFPVGGGVRHAVRYRPESRSSLVSTGVHPTTGSQPHGSTSPQDGGDA